jgi:hypothetical protein
MSTIEQQPFRAFPINSCPELMSELDPALCPDLQSRIQNEQDITAFNELQTDALLKNKHWGDVTDELLDILRLEDDWDGTGAAAPDKVLVQFCFELARNLRETYGFPPPEMVRPTPDGNISFEWQNNFGHFEIEVSNDSVELIYIDLHKDVHYQNLSLIIE